MFQAPLFLSPLSLTPYGEEQGLIQGILCSFLHHTTHSAVIVSLGICHLTPNCETLTMEPYLTPLSVFKASYSASLVHRVYSLHLYGRNVSAQVLWAESES